MVEMDISICVKWPRRERGLSRVSWPGSSLFFAGFFFSLSSLSSLFHLLSSRLLMSRPDIQSRRKRKDTTSSTFPTQTVKNRLTPPECFFFLLLLLLLLLWKFGGRKMRWRGGGAKGGKMEGAPLFINENRTLDSSFFFFFWTPDRMEEKPDTPPTIFLLAVVVSFLLPPFPSPCFVACRENERETSFGRCEEENFQSEANFTRVSTKQKRKGK